jgi:hypothetical protein
LSANSRSAWRIGLPDSTLDPVAADANNVAIDVGGRVRVADTWSIAASYTQLQFFARHTTGRSALADPAVQPITRQPDGGGDYQQWVGVLNVNLTKTF